MECGRYVEEKVAQSESPEFLRHLATCSGCQRDVEEMDDVRAVYRSASNERYAGGVPRLRRIGLATWLSSAAAAAMLAVLVFVLAPRGTPKVPVDSPTASHPFFRVHLEPWKGDARFDHVVSDCWEQLDRLERSR